jgi:acyl-CoA thioesterase
VRFDGAWWVERGPNGGYVGAALVRAMEAELADPSRQLRSITIHYTAAPHEGEAEVLVRAERTGRRLSTLSARLTAGEKLLALALAAFAEPYTGAAEYHEAVPNAGPVAAPAQMPEPPGPEHPVPPFSHNFRMLPVAGAMPFGGDPDAELESGGWLELAEPRPIDAALVVALADSWWPVPFGRLDRVAGAPTIDLTVHVRASVPRDHGPVLGEFRSSVLRDGFFEEDGRLFLPDGTLLAQSRQLALLLA